MKRTSFLIVFMLLLCAVHLRATEADVNGIRYEFDDNTQTASVIPQENGYYAGNVVIPESVIYQNQTYNVSSIGEGAFAFCSDLTSVSMPNSVTIIDYMAFYGCSSLTSILLPDALLNIGSYAFDGCNGLTSVTIPHSVTTIGANAFNACNGLTSVHIDDLSAWCAISFGNFYSNPLSIAHHLFVGADEVTSLDIPVGVTNIGNWAFYGCTQLTSLTLPSSVTSVGPSTFSDCSGLSTVEWNAKDCSDYSSNTPFSTNPITTFIFGDSVQHIPAYLCYGLNSLTTITIPDNVTSIGNNAFKDCSGLTSVIISNHVTDISSNVFAGCNSLTSMIIPDNVTSIENSAFAYCSGLESVTIGNSVTSIAEGTFYGCSSLTSVVWNAIDCIDFDSLITPFYNDYNLYHLDLRSQITSFVFGNNVQHIPANLCSNMTNLSSITIPASVQSIGDNAFAMCSKLQNMTVYAVVPPSIAQNTFDGISRTTPVYVPTAGLNAYKADPLWRQMNIIGMDEGLSDVDYTAITSNAQKTLLNGQLYIHLSDGNLYTIMGLKAE